MITIVWKIEDITKRSDSYRRGRVTAMRVTRDGLEKHIGVREYQFEDGFQALMNLLQEKKALPAAAFIPNAHGGFAYGSRRELEKARFARCIQL